MRECLDSSPSIPRVSFALVFLFLEVSSFLLHRSSSVRILSRSKVRLKSLAHDESTRSSSIASNSKSTVLTHWSERDCTYLVADREPVWLILAWLEISKDLPFFAIADDSDQDCIVIKAWINRQAGLKGKHEYRLPDIYSDRLGYSIWKGCLQSKWPPRLQKKIVEGMQKEWPSLVVPVKVGLDSLQAQFPCYSGLMTWQMKRHNEPTDDRRIHLLINVLLLSRGHCMYLY